MRLLLWLIGSALSANAYSVLTHQAIIDSAWEREIRPLIERRFPGGSDEELQKAHAYAYGGCILQDMGYYPFGSRLFSDLTHYVRSGDFVMNMLDEAQDRNEYAFALGTLAHYVADREGHSLGVNLAVPIVYPQLARRYGEVITYDENPAAHMKTEFGFDVVQVAQGHYAPEAYHDFIGFEVPKPVLERAFLRTYGLELKDIFTSVDLALGSYRFAVSRLIPTATKAAWDLKKDQLVTASPGLTRQKFVYNLSRASYEHEWGNQYERPGIFARILAMLFRIVPRFGPFRSLQFKPPPPQAETLFMQSFNRTLELYRKELAAVRSNRLSLENRDLDTGRATAPGEYRLADRAYGKLLRKLTSKEREDIDPKLRDDILAFYAKRNAPPAGRAGSKEAKETLASLAKLRAAGAR